MPPRRHPANQEPIPNMPTTPEAELPTVAEEQIIDLERYYAFGSVPNLLSRVERPGKKLEVTEDDLLRVSPDAIISYLRAPKTFQEGNYVDGVLLTSQEYLKTPRSVPAISRASRAKTSVKRELLSRDARLSAADSSSEHTLEGYLVNQTKMLDGVDKHLDNLQRLRRLELYPGFRHAKGGELLRLTTEAWELSFGVMLKTVADQAGWNEAEYTRSVEALYRSMTTGIATEYAKGEKGFHPQKARISAWQQYTNLAIRYGNAKKHVFTSRIQGIKQFNASKHTASLPDVEAS